jgi:hypothetical protein
LTKLGDILDTASIGVVVGIVLKALNNPDLLSKAIWVTEEMEAFESIHSRASGSKIGPPLMWATGDYFVESRNYLLDLLNELLWIAIRAP